MPELNLNAVLFATHVVIS